MTEFINKLYWFTNEDGDNILNDFYGEEVDAINYAQIEADRIGELIYVNEGEDIIEVVLP